jgi:uracil-DNA glycosylase family protein
MAVRKPPGESTRAFAALREAMQACRNCDLYRNATQAVPGEGVARASIMLVGEQPGDQEDREGHPFIGPAGKLLDRALEQAGIDRGEVFVTNAVKHFKWEPRGKRRIHKKPTVREVAACADWLHSEIRLVRPRTIVCLGATAAQALLGPKVKVTEARGTFVESELPARVLVTVHPSSILRGDPEDRERAFQAFVADLKVLTREAPP